MDLSLLLEAIEVEKSRNQKSIEIDKIAYHSSSCLPGTLFVCVKGYETDGHDYAAEAVDKGAVALIVERFLPDLAVPQFLVKNGREALAALSARYYQYPSRDLFLVGITATNGKTTTTYMTQAIFEENNWATGLVGTVMVKYADKAEPSKLTTPESLDLQEYFVKMNENHITHVSMEVSSSALELNRVNNVAFNIVALNNVSPDHIDLHGSFEEYYNAKASLIRDAGADQFAVLNLDNRYSADLQTQTAARVVTYGIEDQSGNIVVTNLNLTPQGADFTVEIREPFQMVSGEVIEPVSFPVSISVVGYHSVYNALVAITIGLISGVPIETIQKGIERFKGVERRFQIIYNKEFKIIDDYFVNKENIEATLETLNQLEYNDLHLVYAVRGNRGIQVNRENAQTLAEWIPRLGLEKIILTISESHMKNKDKVLDEELKVVREELEKTGVAIDYYKEMPPALDASLKDVKAGDVILLTGGKGMDFGAKYILNKILEQRPDLDEADVLSPLKNRVAGMDESILERSKK
ncbi:UDP-N-acetylmuramoylalanyl-D-glutamate--2,6-diaminopimelate ligase [Alkalibacterium subtropicum]|uniref:UDP-N-acetylmuramoylalanyl-D-glutamate--2,6-diaminopimelate ligase n=1 Tax=Alkalibacterium subtropicum TaxID=753702 RepID=A0A1I1L825_9LACT|nr:UDP-N-acetylmuramyl-tripeptide synthetase [Alkalibacterium subtropicum]SFC69149.1 UDP-N-acetylmuramoylalanyl-D-glutamate--2,6-diaminopimelate ligase [Alkalibacterium subtropicum]